MEFATDSTVIVVEIGPELYGACRRIWESREIKDVDRYLRYYIGVGHQAERAGGILMLLQPVLAAFGFRGNIHRDTQAVLHPLIGLGQQETSQIKGFLHPDTTM